MQTPKNIIALCAALLLGIAGGATAQQRGFNLIVIGDTQPQSSEQITRLEEEIVPQIRAIAEEYAQSQYPTAVILTGDVVWDTMEFMPRVKSMFEALGVPLYAVIGNHDHDRAIVGNEPLAQSHYEATFGERFYTFELGNTLFIALDNILYTSYDDYSLAIDREQFRWMRKVIRRTPRDKRIAILMHAPIVNYATEEPYPYIRRVLRLVEGREVHFITGHRHRHATADITPTIIEHSVAQVNGNLWFAPICADGTPQGVFCIEERNDSWSWHHRTLGSESYNPIEVCRSEVGILIKVVGWDKRWRIEWVENGENRGAMQQMEICDPDYLYYVENIADYDDVIMQRLRRSARPSNHYFHCLPTGENSEITIIATDRFGREYRRVIATR